MSSLKESIEELEESLVKAAYQGIELKPPQKNNIILNFKQNKEDLYQKNIHRNLQIVKNKAWSLTREINDESSKNKLMDVLDALNQLDKLYIVGDLKGMLKIVQQVKVTAERISIQKKETLNIRMPYVPQEIRNEVNKDIEDMKKCFENGLYRSAVIMCGRVLETALHRKYYEITGVDILEKNPGIGLGTLVAKLTEKNVRFDPGVTQQIHLINNVRVFTVHKKQEVFEPTREQAYATILFTIDVVNKLFAR
ncbi:MAG: DUF4145 domain-containing protein [Candidatus Nanoarchaeia archaeon]